MAVDPLVSVVVPVYNGAKHILATLASVAAQSHRAFEVLVVDDASTDNTVALLANSPVPLTLLRQANAGVSSARNAGLAAAQGEFVCFLDQDDHWYPHHLQTQLQALAQSPEAGVAVSPYQHWYPHEGRYADPAERLPPRPARPVDSERSGWVYHHFLLDCWALTSATTIRRSVLQQHGAFDPQRPFSEDWALWLRLSRHVPFVAPAWPPVLYRQHAEQGSRVPRAVDYRSDLLLGHARQFGLASRDGRAVPEAVFQRQVARYQMEFGRHHLQHGQRGRGVAALAAAWWRQPMAWRYLAMAAAGTLGWRPVDEALQDAQTVLNLPAATPGPGAAA